MTDCEIEQDTLYNGSFINSVSSKPYILKSKIKEFFVLVEADENSKVVVSNCKFLITPSSLVFTYKMTYLFILSRSSLSFLHSHVEPTSKNL
jgi:hypothetical protein